MTRIYLDNHATTPMDPRVLRAMLPFFENVFGNPASHHVFGEEADEAVRLARKRVASLIGACTPEEIVFTSGATEADNLILKGIAATQSSPPHFVTVATEHRAVLETCRALEREGKARVTYLPVERDGLLDLDLLRRAMTPDTILVSVMAANNEIGVLQDLGAIGSLCRERDVRFHTDAAQAAGRVNLDVDRLKIDFATISAHKMYGPKGAGALYVRKRAPSGRRIRLAPLIDGGGHEHGLRSGTLNVPAIVGFGEACFIAASEAPEEAIRIGALRDKLWASLRGALDQVHLNGHPSRRLPGNLNVAFSGVDDESLITRIRGVAVSAGSACTSATPEPSHVLRALGVPQELLYSSIRFGLGRFTTAEEVVAAADIVIAAVRHLRTLTPSAAK